MYKLDSKSIKRYFKSLVTVGLSVALPTVSLFAYVPAMAADDTDKCHYQNFASLPLGTVQGLQSIDGQVNDHPAVFAIDTGASNTVLTIQSVKKFGIPYGHLNQSAPGIGGDAKEYYARVNNLSLGNLKNGRRNIVVLGETSSTPKFDGIVGADLLYQYDVEMSPVEKTMRMFRPINCKKTYLAYWDANADEIDIQKVARQDTREGVVVFINGRSFRALLDSGAVRTLITVDAAAKAGVDLNSPGVVHGQIFGGAGSQTVETWVGTFSEISIGNETIKGAKLAIADLWKAQRAESNDDIDRDSQVDVVLGMDFLRSHRVLISQLQRRMYFSYLGSTVFGSQTVSVKGSPVSTN